MSMLLAEMSAQDSRKKLTRDQTIALSPVIAYDDGRTKQCFKDECDINAIMARFDKTGTISHVAKYEAIYGDFSDFDFFEQTQKLTRGREIFDDLPAEIRQEFGQSPAAFFNFVNDPANKDEVRSKLTGLSQPGRQLPSADNEAAAAAASEPQASETTPTPTPPAETAEKP